MHAAMNAAGAKQDIPPIANFMMANIRLIFCTFLALSVITLVSSIALLKRKNWARIMFVFLMGLGIVWDIGGLFFQQSLFSSMASPSATAPPEVQSQFKSMASTMHIFSSIIAIIT